MTRGGRALARARASRLTPARLARHAAAARASGDRSYAGEWAHLDALLHRLGLAEGGFAVDLAAGDGIDGSCTLPLFRDRGWGGLAIECDPARFALLSHAYAAFPRVQLNSRRVVPAEAADLLRRERVPHGFTLLNLDIDSFDLEVAEALLPAFRPLVVDLEVNEKIPPPVRFAVQYTPVFRWDEGHCYGCSLSAAADVMGALGYRLEGLEHNNAFFVRADVAERGGVEGIAPEDAYRAGYADRPDRAELFPWNYDMNDLLGLEASEVVAQLRRRFRRASASYALQLEPLGREWARGGGAGGPGGSGSMEGGGGGGDRLSERSEFGSPPPPPPTGEPDPPRTPAGGHKPGVFRMNATLAEELSAEEVRARFDQARRRGHPAWLWPEVTVEAWRAALLSIEAATRAVLAGSGAAVLRGEPEAIGIAAYTSGMGPLLGHWVETGEVEAEEGAAAWLRLHLSHNRRRMRRLAGVAAEAVGRLGAAGVTPTVIKGMHTAHAYFPDPATRPLSDVDLLVPPSQAEAMEAALRGVGYRAVLVQRNPYKCDWAPAGAASGPRSLSLTHAEDPFTLDTHASLDRNFFGVATVRLDRLLPHDRGGEWSPAPGARVLGQPLLLLLLATHASEGLHGLSLIRLVELALVIRRDMESGALDWREVIEAADIAGALRFACPALHLCEMLAPGSVPAEAMARFAAHATPPMRRVLAQLTPGTAQRLDRLSLEERFMWAGTAAERTRRLVYALWPAPAGDSLAGLGRIYAGRAWRVVRGRVVR